MPKADFDKAWGCMAGLAICEALSADQTAAISAQMTLPTGLWADGMAMSLALGESLLEFGGVNQRDQMIRYTSWFRYGHLSSTEGCDYIDEAVKHATLRFERTWKPEDDTQAQGDVCLSRVAPVALYFSESREAAQQACQQTTRTTHAGTQTVDACVLLTTLILEAFAATNKDQILHLRLPGLCPEVASLCTDTPDPGDFAACLSLSQALEAFAQSPTFAQGALLCQPHGPRAMAAYGQLAGAWYGAQQIPEAWRKSLAKRDFLEDLTQQLLAP